MSKTYETPEGQGRDDSLRLLREWMVARCDAVVLVGGKTWPQAPNVAGIPIELELARERGLACFVVGGFGGAAAQLAAHPLLSSLKNGLDAKSNQHIAADTDPNVLAQVICDQLVHLPLVRGEGTDGASFRILSLDGGGIKGTYSAAALAAWEEATGRRIVDHFDLIAGTSTGGILALGLGIGLSGKQLLKFYRDRGTTIFPVTSIGSKAYHTIRHLILPKYLARALFSRTGGCVCAAG